MDTVNRIPVFKGHVLDIHVAREARIVHENRRGSKALRNLIQRVSYGMFIANIRLHRDCRAAAIAHLVYDVGQGLEVEIDGSHACPGARKARDNPGTDAALRQ